MKVSLRSGLIKVGVPVLLFGLVLAGCGQQSEQHNTTTPPPKKTEKVQKKPVKKARPKAVKKPTIKPQPKPRVIAPKPSNHVPVVKQSTNGLPAVDLGYGVVGSIDSGAGQKYVSFKIGRWNMLVHGNDVNQPATTAQNDAQYIVNWTQNHKLPVPNKHSSLKYDATTGMATLRSHGHTFHGTLNSVLEQVEVN